MKIIFRLFNHFDLFNLHPIYKELTDRGYATHYSLDSRLARCGDGFATFRSDLEKHGIRINPQAEHGADVVLTRFHHAVKTPYTVVKIKLAYSVNFLHQEGLANSLAAVEGFDGALVFGDYTARQVEAWLPQQRIKVIGVPMYDGFFQSHPDRGAIRERFGVAPGAKFIVYITTWDEHCGVKLFDTPLRNLAREHVLVVRPHNGLYELNGLGGDPYKRSVPGSGHRHYYSIPGTVRAIESLAAKLDFSRCQQGEMIHTMGEIVYAADLAIVDAKSGSLAECVLCAPQLPLIGLSTMSDGEIKRCFLPEVREVCTLLNHPAQLEAAVRENLVRDALAERRAALRDVLFNPCAGRAAAAAADAILELGRMPKLSPKPRRKFFVRMQALVRKKRQRRRVEKRREYVGDLVHPYRRCMSWVRENSLPEQGISVLVGGKDEALAYPEVSGYFIPTLLQWGERDLALRYARWLLDIQQPDGSWQDAHGKGSYVFDSGQVLKGLLAVVDWLPGAESAILRGCDWILSNVNHEGRMTTPTREMWALPSLTDLIHLYCLEPLRGAARRLQRPQYEEAAQKVLSYYLREEQDKILGFHTLSHFYAYMLEGLVDLGETDIARTAMGRVAALQKKDGSVPAYPHVSWTCSVGLLQFAVVWYKLGELERADRAFACVLKRQNASGGFFGSWGRGADYCRKEEISWACKYFLDAFYWKQRTHFEQSGRRGISIAPAPGDAIHETDGRVQCALRAIEDAAPASVLDMGCGKGRITRIIKQRFPKIRVCGLDLGERDLAQFPPEIETTVSGVLSTPFPAAAFDFLLYTESMLHAVDFENALREAARILTPGGTLLIVDKDEKTSAKMQILPWEQWYEPDELAAAALRAGFVTARVGEKISYDYLDGSNGLFFSLLARRGG